MACERRRGFSLLLVLPAILTGGCVSGVVNGVDSSSGDSDSSTVDTEAPQNSDGQPSGALPGGTTAAIMSVTSDEAATCRWDVNEATSYSDMPSAFAITGGTSVRLSVLGTDAGGSCYVLYTGAADACSCEGRGQTRCEAGARLLRLEEQAGSAGVLLVPLQRSIIFDARKGTVTPTATVKVVAADGRAIHQVVNIMGRVRTCALAGSVGGLPACR